VDDVDPWVEEVRVALALNGGVSLAVWMGGCAVELDEARRTVCLRRPDAPQPAAQRGTTYGALCDAFRREFVVDVMSGSSAGGINGALLAAAMTNGRVLSASWLRERWLTLGDFTQLLHPLSERSPASLMRGKYFADQLELAFSDLLENAEKTDPLVTPPALDVTTTDIEGRSLEFRDAWGGTIYAREHRARFRFRAGDDFSAQNLAAAARASASFPLAFEPFGVPPEPGRLAGFATSRWVVDGGLLDNAPIRAALSLIPARPAVRQVRRFLCYLNGDPGGGVVGAPSAGGPTTVDVVGVAVNLPRNAPFADQLLALQDLARRSPVAHKAQLSLLGVDLDALTSTAACLLPAYRDRRRLRALQDLLPNPGDAQRAFDAIATTQRDLPWLPGTLMTPAGRWPWGFQAARRVHHLAIDVIRAALPRAAPQDRVALLKARSAIDGRLQVLERWRAAFQRSATVQKAVQSIAAGTAVEAELSKVEAELGRAPHEFATGIRGTATDLLAVAPLLGEQSGVQVTAALFGSDVADDDTTLRPQQLTTFLARVVAIEVVRRAFNDEQPIDDGQEIAFAQLTPDAPMPILAARPFSAPRTASADVKLCGIILGHFGAFYRTSWRANDFMWGRLDAAARIVEMLTGAYRTRELAATDDERPWEHLARHLASGSPEQLALLEEALLDVPSPPAGDSLEDRLSALLQADLVTGEGRITRVLCTRAAQFEVLCEELRIVVEKAAHDRTLGASAADLGLDGLDLTQASGVMGAVQRLRAASVPLPLALGRDSDDEATSDLAVRTIAQAGLVGLAVVRQAERKVGAPLTALRSVLLPIAGAVSQHVRDRLGVVGAFGAAALYLGARASGANASEVVDARTLSWNGLLLAVVALLAVVGTAAVPFARAKWGAGGGRPVQWALCIALLVFGAIGSAVAGLWGPPSMAHLIVAPGFAAPWFVALPATALALGAALVGPRLLRKPVRELVEPTWRGTWSLVLVAAAAAIVALWSLGPLGDALGSGDLSRQVTASIALAAAPVALVVVVLVPAIAARPRRRRDAAA